MSLNFLMHIFNMSETYLQIIKRKALGGVDYTKYVLLAIIQYVKWSKIG